MIQLRCFDYYVLIGTVLATLTVSRWFLVLLPLVVALDTANNVR